MNLCVWAANSIGRVPDFRGVKLIRHSNGLLIRGFVGSNPTTPIFKNLIKNR